MLTVYSRLKHFRYKLNQNQKIALGKLIAEAYFKQPPKNRPFLYKTKSLESDGTFDVWVYPKRFLIKMDGIIKTFCHENGIRASKRSRILGEKVTSSK